MRVRQILAVSIVALFALIQSAGGQTTRYVDDDNCPGPGTGTIGNPFCSIQDAIDAAVSDDTILVAGGTYLEIIAIAGKTLTIRGTEGAAMTTIDAQQAGVVVTVNAGTAESPITIEGFTITGGLGNLFGGGVLCSVAGLLLNDCVVTDNMCDGALTASGGGLYSISSDVTVTNCDFTSNTARATSTPSGSGGGAIYAGSGSLHLSSCRFELNTAQSPTMTSGGAIFLQLNDFSIDRCDFINNTAESTGEGGGALFLADGTLGTITSCRFVGNATNGDGGAVYAPQTFTFVQCTFRDNIAVGNGGAAYCTNMLAGQVWTFVGCTMSANTGAPTNAVASQFLGHIELTNSIVQNHAGAAFDLGVGTTFAATYSNIEGGPVGTGNIDMDPMFAGPNDLHILAGSPCIDAADLGVMLAEQIYEDVDGAPRAMNDPASPDVGPTPWPGSVLDIGAYEYQPPGAPGTCPADITGPMDGPPDGIVGVLDFLKVLADWGACP